MNSMFSQTFESIRRVRRRERGFSLVELIVVALIGGAILIVLGRFLVNYYHTFHETQSRLRMQRDMRTLTYWIRKDLTALAQRGNNFDLKNDADDFAFIAADDPKDTVDFSTNTTDDGLDQFTYTMDDKTVTRTWDPRGTMSPVERVIALECIEPGKGDTFSITLKLTDLDDSTLTRTDFDGTFENFEYNVAIRNVEVDVLFCKRPIGSLTSGRPFIVERGHIKSVTLYRKSG